MLSDDHAAHGVEIAGMGMWIGVYLIIIFAIYHGRSTKTHLNPGSNILDENLKAGIRMCSAVMLLITSLIAGAIVVHFLEGLSLVESLMLSVGYGNLSFKTDTGRLFAFVWMILSVTCFSRTVRRVVDYSYFVYGDLFGY